MPLIRYEIGETTRSPAGPVNAAAGSVSSRRSSAHGKCRLPGGEQCWPQCSLANQPEVPGILQYQYVQKSLQRIEVHLVVGPRIRANASRGCGRSCASGCATHSRSSSSTTTDIPRSPSGKFEDSAARSLRAEGQRGV